MQIFFESSIFAVSTYLSRLNRISYVKILMFIK